MAGEHLRKLDLLFKNFAGQIQFALGDEGDYNLVAIAECLEKHSRSIQDLESLETTIDTSKERRDKLNQEFDQVNKDLSKLRKEHDDLSSSVKVLKASHRLQSSEAAELNESIKILRREMEVSRKNKEHVEALHQERMQEFIMAKNELEDLRAQRARAAEDQKQRLQDESLCREQERNLANMQTEIREQRLALIADRNRVSSEKVSLLDFYNGLGAQLELTYTEGQETVFRQAVMSVIMSWPDHLVKANEATRNREAELAQYLAANGRLRIESKSARDDLNVMRNELESFRAEHEFTKTKLESANIKLNSTGSQLVSTKDELESSKAQQESTKTELRLARTEYGSIESQFVSIKDDLAREKIQHESIKTQYESTKTELVSEQRITAEQREKTRELEAQILRLREQHTNVESCRRTLEEQLSSANDKYTLLEDRHRSVTSERSENERKIEGLNKRLHDLEPLGEKIDQLQKASVFDNCLIQELRTGQEGLAALQAAAKGFEKDLYTKDVRIERLEAQRATLEQDLRREHEDSRDQLVEATRISETLRGRIRDYKRSQQVRDSELTNLRDDLNEQHRTQMADALNEADLLRMENAHLKTRIERFERRDSCQPSIYGRCSDPGASRRLDRQAAPESREDQWSSGLKRQNSTTRSQIISESVSNADSDSFPDFPSEENEPDCNESRHQLDTRSEASPELRPSSRASPRPQEVMIADTVLPPAQQWVKVDDHNQSFRGPYPDPQRAADCARVTMHLDIGQEAQWTVARSNLPQTVDQRLVELFQWAETRSKVHRSPFRNDTSSEKYRKQCVNCVSARKYGCRWALANPFDPTSPCDQYHSCANCLQLGRPCAMFTAERDLIVLPRLEPPEGSTPMDAEYWVAEEAPQNRANKKARRV